MKYESETPSLTLNRKPHWKRDETAAAIVSFEELRKHRSQRQFCKTAGIPGTTLQHQLNRKKNIDASPVAINFFEHPDGLAFLHRLLNAVHFSFNQNSPAGIRAIVQFIELSGLSSFVAGSYGACQKISKKMEAKINEYGQSEKERQTAEMPKKKISLAEDETFHPEISAVGTEPVSGYIFLEKYVERRDGVTWNQEIRNALSDLPVEVIQVTGDEGGGQINHVKKGLKAHHSPDLFHIPYEISKGASAALSSKIKKAEKEYEKAGKEIW